MANATPASARIAWPRLPLLILGFIGLVGPFCLESIVTDKLEFKVFEISCRIVAGTNLYISGSPYSDLVEHNLSNGRRIAEEIKMANKLDLLHEIIT